MDFFATEAEFLDEEERRELLSLCSEEHLEAGSVLFDYQDPAGKLYFLKEGRLAVHKFTGFQEKMQVVALLDPGAVVGEAALLDNHIRKTRVTAIEASRLLCLEKKDFAALQKDSPKTVFLLLKYFFYITNLRLEKTSERLARIL